MSKKALIEEKERLLKQIHTLQNSINYELGKSEISMIYIKEKMNTIECTSQKLSDTKKAIANFDILPFEIACGPTRTDIKQSHKYELIFERMIYGDKPYSHHIINRNLDSISRSFEDLKEAVQVYENTFVKFVKD